MLIHLEQTKFQKIKLKNLVRKNFDMKPSGIISHSLDLKRPIYKKTASYGHFGRNEPEFTWEKTDKAEALKQGCRTLVIQELTQISFLQ